jgi:hypothetical protein
MKTFCRSWRKTPNNATTGFEFGMNNVDKDWLTYATRWHTLAELFDVYFSYRSFTMAFKIYHWTDWRFYARVAR